MAFINPIAVPFNYVSMIDILSLSRLYIKK